MRRSPLKLDQLHRDILVRNPTFLSLAALNTAARGPYEAIVARRPRHAGSSPLLAARLGAIAELAITSGRVRDAYGPGAELASGRYFSILWRGREIAASVAALNTALKPLEENDRYLNAIARAPGADALTIKYGSVPVW